MATILLVDDDVSFIEATSELLTMLGHEVTTAGTVAGGIDIATQGHFDIAILDLMLPDGSGLHVLDTISKANSASHIAIITGHPSVKNLVKTLCGPHISYLVKPLDLEQLQALVEKVEKDQEENDSSLHFGCLVGESPVMTSLYEMIERVARSSANVMLMGESGVGKEMVARAIHKASDTSGPYVAANCGAFSRELIGSELFGHEKGAFTGAVARKAGLFERANGGTLFLDEVTEMPLDLQPTLLRVLETGMVTRVGGTSEIPVNCRIVSATNRHIEELAEKDCLREDLYFRLAVFPITVPPLNERLEDIPYLAKHFLHDLNVQNGTAFRLAPEDLHRLSRFDWPGNVRELRHAIHRAFIMTPQDSSVVRLPEKLASPFARTEATQSGLRVGRTIEEMERELITMTLAQLQGDKRRAAEMLGISLKTLYNRLNDYEQNGAKSNDKDAGKEKVS